ncbi:Aste57867_12310 [Aphanomyces stellatus]|uniref:Aste57867_12310 protein n=1 Tax=Aphanomyces stellatus TaxID=120398 RepID=A0A485KV93_9STRA|nr:hypothetical protein As57867_012264 [Aphanomyces stellatus]VFT89162.1 Aste57867_12310 [Aphanomyces stellatus]
MVNAHTRARASVADEDRREYLRQKQRAHRCKVKSERILLLQDLAALQDLVRALPQSLGTTAEGMLPWQIVADVFRAASRRSRNNHNELTEETNVNAAALNEMLRYLNAWKPRPTPSLVAPDAAIDNHSFVTLFANGEARNTAKQWLTQQLYYNTDRAFALFPHDTDDFADTMVSLTPSQMRATEFSQVIYDAPLKTVLNVTRRKLHWGYSMAEMDIETSGNTVLYRNQTEKTHYWNLLEGSFYEADRCVLVYRRIHDDETYSSASAYEQHALQWMDLRQIGPRQTLVRFSSMRMICSPAQATETWCNPDLKLPSTQDGSLVQAFSKDIQEKFASAYRIENENGFRHIVHGMRTALSKEMGIAEEHYLDNNGN